MFKIYKVCSCLTVPLSIYGSSQFKKNIISFQMFLSDRKLIYWYVSTYIYMCTHIRTHIHAFTTISIAIHTAT